MSRNREARRALAQQLRTAAELDAFCLDHFPQVHARFTDGMDRLARENLLLSAVPAEQVLAALACDRAPPPGERPPWIALALVLSAAIAGGAGVYSLIRGRTAERTSSPLAADRSPVPPPPLLPPGQPAPAPRVPTGSPDRGRAPLSRPEVPPRRDPPQRGAAVRVEPGGIYVPGRIVTGNHSPVTISASVGSQPSPGPPRDGGP